MVTSATATFRAATSAIRLAQPWQVVDVLHTLPHGLVRYRELLVPACHGEQLRGALPLLPQRRAPARVAAGEQQGAGGALPEPGREQRRPAELADHQLLDLGRVEQHVLGRGQHVGAGVVHGVGQPEHDPVVGARGGDLDPAALPHPGRDRQRPRAVDLRTER